MIGKRLKKCCIFNGYCIWLRFFQTKLISRYYDNSLAGYLSIKKTWKLVTQKYYLLTLRADIEIYLKEFDVCLILKAVRYISYEDL